MTPSSGTSTVPPFKFRHRGEKVDWRQINKPGWGAVDPGLLKLLQLGQLSMEWLLHCQEVLSLNQHAAEERLEAARMEQKQLLEQQSQQEEKVKALNEELMLKGKVVSELQSQLLLCSHKCTICKKGFLTPQFLQSHMQRRHPEDHESQLQSDRDMKSKIDILKTEISGLKEQNVQLQQKLQLKEELWQSKLQQTKDYHESEMNKEMEQRQEIQLSIEAQRKQEMEQRLQEMQLSIEAQRKQEMEQRLQEMQLSIEAQRKQEMEPRQEMQLSIEALREQVHKNKVEVPVVVKAPAPETESTRVVLDSSSASEPKQSTSVTVNVRKRNLSTKKKLRRKLKWAVSKRLEDLGVKPNQSGVKNREFASRMAKGHSEEDKAAKGMPGYWRYRGQLENENIKTF
ncbi:unnamed protein product [Pleuronectes platessa]|uniref:C2H2-type domain-containing protein n=1 Tax=Pleuronectes platessa TaxID=8262 RepID=A0A9N7TRA3_PLEPL|nr:unnamed protein product [Pleuronectes platessa]